MIAVLPARFQPPCLHVLPAPLSTLSDYVNDYGGTLTQFAFYLAGALDAADTVHETGAPFLTYLPVPDLTVYLETSEQELRQRMDTRPDRSPQDRLLVRRPGRAGPLPAPGRRRPTAVTLTTDGHDAEELSEQVALLLETRRAATR